MEVKRIHLIHYCHCDFAWTNTRDWHKKRYIAFFNKLLDSFRAGKNFTVSIDNTKHAFCVFEKYSPERLEEFKTRVSEGKISIVNGGAALVRPNDCGDELFIRNMQKGKNDFMDKTGGAGRCFLNADTGFGHGQLPQILKNGGYDLYRFYRPNIPLDKKGVPREFIYQGIDGTKIFVTRGDYASSLFNTYQHMDFGNEKEVADTFKKEVIDPIMPLQQSEDLILFVGGDDILPLCNPKDEYEYYPELVEIWNRQYPKIQMRFSTLDEYLEHIEKQNLPTLNGTIEPCELFYNVPMRGDKGLWKVRFEAEKELVSLEYAVEIAEKLGCAVSYEKISALWDRLIEFSGHAMNFLLEVDYSRILAGAKSALTEITRYKYEVMERICSKISCGRENEYIIFNLNDHAVLEQVNLHITRAENVSGFTIKDSEKILEYQIEDFNLGDKPFVNCDFSEIDVVCKVEMPPMSAKAVYVEFDGTSALPKAKRDMVQITGDFKVDNGKICLTFENGRLKTGIGELKLYHTKQGDSWYNRSEIEKIDSFAVEKCILKENGPLRYKVVTEGKIANHSVRQTITLHHGSNRVDFKTEIWVEKETYVDEVIGCIKEINPEIKPFPSAGISKGEDCYNIIKAGSSASGCSSAIAKAENPLALAEEMIQSIRKAWDELHK